MVCLSCFDAFTAKFIRSKVQKLIGRAGFTKSDRPDLIQEFALDLIQRRKNFDPDTATWEAFVVVVCENRYATILEHRQAEMRSHAREGGSLNRPIKSAGGQRADFGSTIPDSQQAQRTGRPCRSHEEALDLEHDIAEMLKNMPPRMREVCELVMCGTKTSPARELGMSQWALYEMFDRILARFEDADLRDYLK